MGSDSQDEVDIPEAVPWGILGTILGAVLTVIVLDLVGVI